MSFYIERTKTCWLWRGKTTRNHPYPRIRGGESLHRIVWELTRGHIPDGMCVLHKCDNMRCVRPAHLFLGTHADNVRDMVSKGRNVRGRHQWAAKLSEKDIPRIRNLISGGYTQKKIAEMFGVTSAAIYMIKIGKNWSYIK